MVVEIMAGEFQELFNELLYGSGAWIGFLIILSIILLVSVSVKHSGIIFIPICIFIGIFYLDNVAVNSNFMWSAIIMFLLPFFLFFRLMKED